MSDYVLPPTDRLNKMTEEELAQERMLIDQRMQVLRELKKAIQNVIDLRVVPLGPADHTIGGGNG